MISGTCSWPKSLVPCTRSTDASQLRTLVAIQWIEMQEKRRKKKRSWRLAKKTRHPHPKSWLMYHQPVNLTMKRKHAKGNQKRERVLIMRWRVPNRSKIARKYQQNKTKNKRKTKTRPRKTKKVRIKIKFQKLRNRSQILGTGSERETLIQILSHNLK